MIGDIGLWAACEASALHSVRGPKRKRAATWVLELALGLADERARGVVAFDRFTSSAMAAKSQGDWVRRALDSLISGWHVIARSERRPAVIVETEGRGMGAIGVVVVCVDRVGAGWLHVGAVLAKIEAEGVTGGRAPNFAAVALAQRRDMDWRVPSLTLTKRPAADVLAAYQALEDRRARVVRDGEKPRYSPGIHCSGCRVQRCPVRSTAGPGGIE